MALGTATNIRRDIHNYPRVVTADFPIASYTAGGETPTASNFSLRAFADDQSVEIASPMSSNDFIVKFDGTKVRAYAPVKVTHNATPGGAAVNFVDATDAFESNVAGAADQFVPGEEVPAGTNVGTVRLRGVGYP